MILPIFTSKDYFHFNDSLFYNEFIVIIIMSLLLFFFMALYAKKSKDPKKQNRKTHKQRNLENLRKTNPDYPNHQIHLYVIERMLNQSGVSEESIQARFLECENGVPFIPYHPDLCIGFETPLTMSSIRLSGYLYLKGRDDTWSLARFSGLPNSLIIHRVDQMPEVLPGNIITVTGQHRVR